MSMRHVILFAVVSFLLAACGQAETPADTTPTPSKGGSPAAPGPAFPTEPGNPGDGTGPVYLSSAALIVMESYPVQVSVLVQGDLPTPCHQFGYALTRLEDEPGFSLVLYSTAAADAVCVQMLQPFEESIRLPLEGEAEGTYKVYVDGQLIGEFDYPG
jgi:hypothetical protein